MSEQPEVQASEQPKNPLAAAIGRGVAALRQLVASRAVAVVGENGGPAQEKAVAEEDRELAPEEVDALVAEFRGNFDANTQAHPKLHSSIRWGDVEAAIRRNTNLLSRLRKMMAAGGQVDVVADVGDSFELSETVLIMPEDRIGIPYDHWVVDSACSGMYNKDTSNAVDFAAARGAKLMTREQWLGLRQSVPVDQATPIPGGKSYCDGFRPVYPPITYASHEIMLGIPAEVRAADKDKPGSHGGMIPTAGGCDRAINLSSCAACVVHSTRAFRMVMDLPKVLPGSQGRVRLDGSSADD